MRNFYISILFFCLCLLSIISTQAKTYNPLQYGLNNAHSGVERYWVLYKTHELAKNNNGKVIYNGIDSLDIEIPRDAISIPLSEYTDFCGVVLTVKNSNKDMLGAIIGDIVGSCWEFNRTNDYNFEWLSEENGFTDDTICTVAVADALLHERDFGE